MGDTGSGGGAADSYIGSLISLTSKSEIRYEGILYTVDTVNSNIALQDVRSFGTEGRKKDGPQIPSSDKVYDYIIFRGTDIKDLQVKSSPPPRVPPAPQGHHDPAIISAQTQVQPVVPPSAGLNTGTAAAGTNPTDIVNPGTYPNIPSAAYQNGMPYSFQPYGGMGTWNMPQMPPAANGTTALPMYWPNYYRPPLQQSQIPLQTPSTLTSNYLVQPMDPLSASSSLPESSSLPSNSTKDLLADASQLSSSAQMPGSIEYTAVSLALEEKTTVVTTASKVASQMAEVSLMEAPSVGTLSTQSSKQAALLDHSKSSDIDTQNQPPLFEHTIAEVSSMKESIISTSDSQPQYTLDKPLLPLPGSSVRQDQGYDSSSSSLHVQRGRGRGRGYGMMNSQGRNKFAEDFDFMAMNEKFNKDEVWGELGKAGGEETSEDYHHEEEDVAHVPAAYVKDDFFDSLSSNAFDRSGQMERPRFSEQRRLDTETFGRFSVRHHGGRGGRGSFRGGNRGGYYGGGRGNGYGGRGRSTPRYPQSY